MTIEESKELNKALEHYALRKIDKDPQSAYAEGRNYGIMLMFEIAKEIIEKRAKE